MNVHQPPTLQSPPVRIPLSQPFSPPPVLEGLVPVALALLRVRIPEDWTGLESTLIRLEATMARRQGWLYRQHETLFLYFSLAAPAEGGSPVCTPGSGTGDGPAPAEPPRPEKVDIGQLEAALECVEQLVHAMTGQGGCGAVLTLGRGYIAGRAAWCDAFEEARKQLEAAHGNALYLSGAILARLPTRTLGAYERSPSSLEGFCQRQVVDHSTGAPQPFTEILTRLQDAGPRLARALYTVLHWRPLLLAIPGVAMFFLTPYLLDLPADDALSPARLRGEDELKEEEALTAPPAPDSGELKPAPCDRTREEEDRSPLPPGICGP